MYFWNTRQLASDLQEGKVAERQKMWYLFAYVVPVSLELMLVKWIPSEYALSKMADFAVLGVTIIGLLACYRANSRGDGKDFVVRFICMSWPVLWRIVAVFLPLGLAFGFVIGVTIPEYGDPLSDALAVISAVVYYALIRRWLIKISSGQVGAVSSER
jgi:hypothetical protein